MLQNIKHDALWAWANTAAMRGRLEEAEAELEKALVGSAGCTAVQQQLQEDTVTPRRCFVIIIKRRIIVNHHQTSLHRIIVDRHHQ